MEAQAEYVSNNTPIVLQDDSIESWIHRRWYHNGATIAALILLINTIGLMWFLVLREMLSPIIALIFSLLFAGFLAANASKKA